MVLNLKAILGKIKRMEEAGSFTQMEKFMKEIGKMIKRKGMECIHI